MTAMIMIPIYIALWLIAAHIQYLMRNEKKQDKIWIYPVFTMIGISLFCLLIPWSH